MRRLALVLAVALLPAAAAGQQYQPWNNPDGSTPGTGDTARRTLIERLNSLVDEAEKSRAADPAFLSDLRDLARGYERPWRTLVLADDFGDGDFTGNPRWTVTAGRYLVQRGWGLRSIVDAEPAAPEQRRLSGKEVAANIFGQILQQAIDPGRAAGQSTAGGGVNAAAIQTGFRLSNAFAIEMDLSSWKPQGRLEIGPYQGAPEGSGWAAGYVLVYTPGGIWELLRVSARGSSVIDSRSGRMSLEDKKTHRIEWTRHDDGRMTVSIDGREMLKVTDRAVRTPFDGFRMVNRGGDYILKRIRVFATGKG